MQFTMFLLLLALLSLGVEAAVPEVVMGPSLLNAFLNSTVNFTCSGRGPNSSSFITTIQWRVNSAIPPSDEFQVVQANTSEIGYAFSTLTFTAKQELNNSLILCTVFAVNKLTYHIERIDSPLAYLRIQGLLAPVTNLTLNYGPNVSLLSWVPSFSLDGLDIGYNVTLSNSSHAHSFSPSNVNGFNISTREFLSPCSTYTFTVQPWNGVGVSPPSSLTKFFSGVPKAPMLNSVLVYDIAEQSEGDIEALIHFPVTSSCFTNQNITAISSSLSSHYQTILTIPDNSSQVVLSIQGLPPDRLISLELTLSNRFGGDSVGGIVLSTYDIQNVTIINSTSDEGRICFQCLLSTNSSALGCHLVLTPDQTITGQCSLVQSANLSIIPSTDDPQSFISCIAGLYSGTYRVSAYDIESDGSPSDKKSLTLTDVAIKGLSCPSPTVVVSTSTTTEYSVTNSPETGSVSVTVLVPSNTGVNDSATVIRTAGILVGTFGLVILIAVSVLVAVFIYNRCHSKGGVLTITSDRSQSVPMDHSNRRATETARSSTVDTDSPELMTVHPSYTSEVRSKYSPQLVATEPVTIAMTPPKDNEGDDDTISKPPLNKRQILVLQQDSKASNSRSSSTSSGSAESFPPLRYTRYGSGEYDHLTGQENQEATTVPGQAAAQLDSIVIDSKPYYKESDIL
ncbi:PREDICTED: uncharacterized protein LOC109580254 isoform X2 [Amphimedon queenslandica]|uniref:Fibronectin type-III domain-containing protein n=1 Tax=Amphimedon queenslandica TaxID=400682 RepID=A0AAN0IWJ7_AMPQE|nr:PREDICTED: uncharacterized protein LOC109580254 isoform X2 [Amphimedon queenslandica]|eukprot:XP_019848803.1 PREDICTED: uncharacterized protein LOC109580254 isoform X2 [Amphimedon queenslandica]